MSKGEKTFIAGVVLYAAVVWASMKVNFIPYGVEGWIVVLVSSVLGILLPVVLSQRKVRHLSNSNRRWLYFYMWLGGTIFWAPVVGSTIPVALSFISATPGEQELTVASKRSRGIRFSCNGLVIREYENLFDNTICVNEGLWDSVSPGAKLRVVGVQNELGFRVREVYAR